MNSKSNIESRWSLINYLYHNYDIGLDYEEILSKNFSKLIHFGDFVVDIGAHSGRHTETFLKLTGNAGKVIAFEPLEYFSNEIVKKFKNIDTLIVRNVALSNFTGTSEFIAALGTPEESGFRKKDYIYPDLANPQTINVNVCKLDDELTSWIRCDYIKIDIEGGELDCLAGAQHTISKFRPLISFECGKASYSPFGKTSKDFFDFATENRYIIYDLFGHRLDTLNLWQSIVDRARTWDFYFVPLEKVVYFEQRIFVEPLP